MKVSIITLHSIFNPGSVLQAFGLQEFLKRHGYDAKIIDYRPIYSRIGRNKIKGLLRKVIFLKNELSLKRKYESFINKRLTLTDRTYKSFSNLKKYPPEFDFYISGSDQLWNADYDCGNDGAYYLSFVKKGYKISYSTSMGKKNISDKELEKICSRVNDYSMISVREKSNSESLAEMLNRQVYWVCDPVFLLSRETYEEMTIDLPYKNYVVVYLSAESELLNSVVEDIKSKTGCEVILLGGNTPRCACDYHIKDLGPYDFLSLISGAKLVISSSFHATAFSHIFHKKFGVILPKGNGERIESLLQLTGLTSRIITDRSDFASIYEEIDYSEVDEKLQKFIDYSKDVLLNALLRKSDA